MFISFKVMDTNSKVISTIHAKIHDSMTVKHLYTKINEHTSPIENILQINIKRSAVYFSTTLIGDIVPFDWESDYGLNKLEEALIK